MKILLAHNSLYFPSHGGGDKSNRLLMESLAALGHTVQVMARLENFSQTDQDRLVAELAARDTPMISVREGIVTFERNGVMVFTVANFAFPRAVFSGIIADFDPDVIICSTDDPGALLLEIALRATHARIVYLVRATVAVPFGPDCAFSNPAKTEMLGRVDSMIGVSEYVAQYVRQWSGIPAIHVPISLLDSQDYSDIGGFDNEFVLMVNPCAVKGIAIFTALAEAMPDVPFAAVPTWGTNADDLAQLKRHPNIHLFEPVDDIAVLLRRTSVVLVPSVWAEARSRMVVESMIRGIPVLASDVGGLHEAKLGVEYLLPVNPIRRYAAGVDANMVPIAEVPPQNIRPWHLALQRLLTDRDHYEDVARRGRKAALDYAEKLHAGWLSNHLLELIRKPKRVVSAALTPVAQEDRLSPTKRQLLALRLNKSKPKPSGNFFPPALEFRSAASTLFCFPWAGGGTMFYKSWNADLLPVAEIFPALLPGRESRAAEPPFTAMRPLIDALTEAIRPHLSRRFAFFGHSMGAGIAFELARSLRRQQLPMPHTLFVSSARAPHLRGVPAPGPDPDEATLIEELNRLGELPNESGALSLLLPALRADIHLYRNYVVEPEPPLDVPIHAYYGKDDPSLTPEQVEAWKSESASGGQFDRLPGGHFFIRTHREQFLRAFGDMLSLDTMF